MDAVTTFGNFRNNIADYFDIMLNGGAVSVRDGRKDENIITMFAKTNNSFDWDEHIKWMKSFKPLFTEEDDKSIKNLRKRSRSRLKKYDW